MQVELMAKKPVRYARVSYSAGQRFAATQSDAKVLIAIGQAEIAKPAKVDVVTKVEVPEDVAASDGEEAGRRRRTYRRRDVVAESNE